VIDIIFLTFNRIEFTKEAIKAMIANTDWTQVSRLMVYDDGSTDGTREYLQDVKLPVATDYIYRRLGGPVAIMNDYLSRKPADVFAKIDNDVLLPPGWLPECLKVLDTHPKLDLLGIEAFFPVQAGQAARGYVPAKHIGGIGLMRRRCFKTQPKPNGRFGFTAWQVENKGVVKGWLNPSLPVILMDRLPDDPWRALSKGYIGQGWQRDRPPYSVQDAELMGWWKP
jgi:glycosyltransferase involved in cell wall biosynthesis